jgi:hypothetical protein
LDAQVTALHGRYKAAVIGLFQRYKADFGYSDDEELVVE